MPYTSKQLGLFRAAGHNKSISQRTGIPMEKARLMAQEGLKPTPVAQVTSAIMKRGGY